MLNDITMARLTCADLPDMYEVEDPTKPIEMESAELAEKIQHVQGYKGECCWTPIGHVASLADEKLLRKKGYTVNTYKTHDDYYDCDRWNTKVSWPKPTHQ